MKRVRKCIKSECLLQWHRLQREAVDADRASRAGRPSTHVGTGGEKRGHAATDQRPHHCACLLHAQTAGHGHSCGQQVTSGEAQ